MTVIISTNLLTGAMPNILLTRPAISFHFSGSITAATW
jgi:uncharacterized membrane protein